MIANIILQEARTYIFNNFTVLEITKKNVKKSWLRSPFGFISTSLIYLIWKGKRQKLSHRHRNLWFHPWFTFQMWCLQLSEMPVFACPLCIPRSCWSCLPITQNNHIIVPCSSLVLLNPQLQQAPQLNQVRHSCSSYLSVSSKHLAQPFQKKKNICLNSLISKANVSLMILLEIRWSFFLGNKSFNLTKHFSMVVKSSGSLSKYLVSILGSSSIYSIPANAHPGGWWCSCKWLDY